MLNPFIWGWDRIRQKGIAQTSRIATSVVLDAFFDWKYGTDTNRQVEVDSLETASTNKSHAVHYQATKARPFLRLLQELRLPRNSVFVDLGSGKGRVLLLAAQFGFKRIVGIEFCARLCAQARKNVEIFRRRTGVQTAIAVVEADVADYEIQDDETVFFLFNPFEIPILARVLEQIRRSVQKAPRPIWMIYCNPLHDSIIQQSGLFTHSEFFEIGGAEFRVFTTAGRPATFPRPSVVASA